MEISRAVPTSDKRPFTHRIFVDFSGDDGDPGTPGSSRSVCIACIISKEGDLRYNQGVALDIKKLIGCGPRAELKYVSLRRHRKKGDAISLLRGLKAKVVLMPVLKERILEDDIKDAGTKKLIFLMHKIPLEPITNDLERETPNFCFQLVWDEVAYKAFDAQMDEFAKDQAADCPEPPRSDWLVLGNSRSNLMLQLADVLAGAGREYFDSLLDREKPLCKMCWEKKWRPCKDKKQKRKPEPDPHFMSVIHPLLLRERNGKVFETGFIARPPGIKHHFRFVDCVY